MIDGETRTRILSNLRAVPDSRRKSGAPCSVALARSLGRIYHADAEWRGSHPFNAFAGTDATARGFWFPLMRAFPDLERRDDLFFGGRWKGSDFVAACGHFVGTFAREFAGIPPSGGAAFLRYGEFHKISGGGQGKKIQQTTILVDLVDLARQSGVFPLPESLGAEMMFPAPATGGGLMLSPGDGPESQRSLALMEAMLNGLRAYRGDLESLASMNQKRFWHPK